MLVGLLSSYYIAVRGDTRDYSQVNCDGMLHTTSCKAKTELHIKSFVVVSSRICLGFIFITNQQRSAWMKNAIVLDLRYK